MGPRNSMIFGRSMMFCKSMSVAALAASTLVLSAAPGLSQGQTFRWVRTGIEADWTGNDAASATGRLPRYAIDGAVLCGTNKVGAIAICWTNRVGGYPQGVPTNIVGRPTQWCAYKSAEVTMLTPPTGTGPKGQVFICGPVVNP